MKIKLTDKVYTVGKYVAAVVLPATAAFYASVGALWGFENVTEVVGTITSADTLLGALLLVSTAQFNKEQKSDESPEEPLEGE